jgi:putative flippase GtrA
VSSLRTDVLGQGLRFAVAGAIVALVYLLSTLTLSSVVGLPFQLALAGGFCLAVTVHFTLQRFFVWGAQEEFALPFHHQMGRYLLLTGVQYGITAANVALLPSALGLPTTAVYVVTVGLLGVANFLLFRNRVFHAGVQRR